MQVNGKAYRTIWQEKNEAEAVRIIDQRKLPFTFSVERIQTATEMARAIQEMWVRGAPLIGAAAAFGMYLACLETAKEQDTDRLERLTATLLDSRPTAVNLRWAVERQLTVLQQTDDWLKRCELLGEEARKIADEDVEICRQIGVNGLPLIEAIHVKQPERPINILTHCNAGWLATVDWGTATSPIYHAHEKGIPVHVWVDETRPRNQGAKLTAWELQQHGVPHTIIADNAGGHLMQHGQVDMCIVGTDRTTYTGDVCNKIGTYLKALAAWDNKVPFYVALPSPTIDWRIRDGVGEIPIEERAADELTEADGIDVADGQLRRVHIMNTDSPAANFAFDVTPAKYVTGLITEKGVCSASEEGIQSLFPQGDSQ
ncbi:MAG: S-methyl-5-thioribose-1-phosphate isomerase [Bacteroidota bacterium]